MKKINIKQELHEQTQDNVVYQHVGKTIEENQLAYSDLVITGRAIPSQYDGMKPVHRRILMTFKMEPGAINKNIKSARIVGATIGKLHPHGDLAVYGALIELTQPFKNRTPLTIGQGNFGSISGDSPAAQRYSEVKLPTESANLLFENLDKDGVVPWTQNYDGTLLEPMLLPVKYPLAILNGTTGVAYAGITTKIPSYNIAELTNLYIYIIKNKLWDVEYHLTREKRLEILEIIPTVDLATGANVYFEDSTSSEDSIFNSKFKFRMRASYEIDKKHNCIIFKNVPIDMTLDRIIEQAKNAGLSYKLIKDKKVVKSDDELLNISENIDIISLSSFDDDEYKNDAEITFTFKRGSNLDLELIKIFKYTDLDSSYSANMTFIDKDQCPVSLSLYEQSVQFLEFRLHTVYKGFQFDIKKLSEQLHLMYGMIEILSNLDRFIEIVKNAPDEELYNLIKIDFSLDDTQIEFLLNIQLKKLSKTSIDSLKNDIVQKETKREELEGYISSKESLYKVIQNDYEDLLTKSIVRGKKSARLTQIIDASRNIDKSDLIEDKEIIVMYMEDDTIAYVDKNKFKLKNKGTKTTTNKINNDFELSLKFSESCRIKDTLLLMTNQGRVFKIKAFMFNEQFRFIGNVLNLNKDEKIVNILKLNEDVKFYMINTVLGKIKGVNGELFNNITSNRAITAIKLEDKDSVVGFIPYSKLENEKIILLTNQGRIIKYPTDEILLYSGTAKGTKAATLLKKEKILKSFIFVETENTFIIGVSDIGRAKKSLTSKIADKKRTNSPNLFFSNNNVNGTMVCGEVILDDSTEVLMILTERADVSLIKVNGFNTVSRTATGSIGLISIDKNEKVKACKKINVSELTETQNQIVIDKIDDEN